jgi:amidase
MSTPAIDLDAHTIAILRARMDAREITAHDLTAHCLSRIEADNGKVNTILELNPDAPAIAAAMDAELGTSGARGPLHGMPILVKDNIDTADKMMTTAGSLALVGHHAKRDADVVTRLRQAGAVILGKTNLSEWANFRSARSSSGWSSRGGQTRNPYALNRSPGGSSSGSAVAVASGFCVAAIGTETDGSIVSPSAMCSIVGIKPSVGLVSRSGIIPISHSQDTAGPMARCVADAMTVLHVISGSDALATEPEGTDPEGNALEGARIGVAASYCGFDDAVDVVIADCLAALRDAGAIIIDDLELTPAHAIRPSELTVMMCEFKAGLNAYLGALEPHLPVHSLDDLIAFNTENQIRTMPFFGQDILMRSTAMPELSDAGYLEALATARRLTRIDGIDALIDAHELDALVAPTTCAPWLIDWVNGDNRKGGSACPAAVAGYPSITVPAGSVFGLPIGLSFFSKLRREPTLGALAQAIERARPVRRPPAYGARAEVPSE